MDPLRGMLYKIFDPARELTTSPEDSRLYVDWQAELMPHDDPKTRLANSIALGLGAHQCRFVTGHRGVGKTTELRRVERMLMTGAAGPKVFTSFLEGSKWLDTNDVDARDIVFQIVRQLVADLERAEIGLGWERWHAFTDDLRRRLGGVSLDSVGLEAGGVTLEALVKDSPDARHEFRTLLDRRLPTVYDLVNELLRAAGTKLEARGFSRDIVVIVDELDRITMKPLDGARGLTNHEQIFFNESRILRGLACDMVYTIPIELAYSPSRHRFETDYSAEIFTVPMIPIFERDGQVNPRGHAALLEVLRLRADAAGGRWDDLWSEAVVERMARLSGGYLRQAFLFIRSALERGGLPIGEDILSATLRRHAIDINLPLTDAQRALLAGIHADKRGRPEEPEFFKLLKDLYIFTYEDGQGPWYDRNPLLGEGPA